MANKLSNISISDYRKFLKLMGCTYIRTKAGHEMWTKKEFLRPITFQTHIDPVPERIVAQCLLPLGITKKEMIDKISSL